MKNEKIISAWDRVTPNQYQKEKMRSDLELRMEAEPSLREKKENRNLDVYRLPAEKKKSSWLPIAAAIALVLAGTLAFAWLQGNREEPDPSMVAPTEETTAPAEDREAAFQPVIDKYMTAITEGWDGGRCAQEDISILTRDVKSLDDLGYSLRDMNGDGQNELLITDGNVICDMYVLIQGEVYHMFTSMERNAWFLCGENAMLNIASSSAAEMVYSRMSYVDGKELWAQYVIHSDGTTEGNVPWDLEEGPVGEEMMAFIHRQNPRMYICHTPFSGNVVGTDIYEYEATLPLFAAAIPEALENFSKDQPVTFCFYDADGDGDQELILGAGKICYAVLRILESTGEVKIAKPFSGEKTDWFFCENGVRKYMNTNENGIKIDFASKNGMYYETFMSLRYEEDDDRWTQYDWAESPGDETERTVLNEDQIRQVLESYRPLNLNWQPIQDFPVKVPLLPIKMFDQVFAPVASGIVDNTWNQLDPLLYYAGEKNWGRVGNQIEVANPADRSSSLIAVLSGEEGEERIEQLLFTIMISDTRRIVSVDFTPEGKVYRAFADPGSKGVKLGSVEELRAFLIQEEKSIAPWRLAEEFAYAWFTQDKQAMDKAAKNGTVREFMDGEAMGPETEIEKMTIVFPSGNYSTSYLADVSIAFYEPGVTDSYTYLNLHMYKNAEDGEWFVEMMSLEK